MFNPPAPHCRALSLGVSNKRVSSISCNVILFIKSKRVMAMTMSNLNYKKDHVFAIFLQKAH